MVKDLKKHFKCGIKITVKIKTPSNAFIMDLMNNPRKYYLFKIFFRNFQIYDSSRYYSWLIRPIQCSSFLVTCVHFGYCGAILLFIFVCLASFLSIGLVSFYSLFQIIQCKFFIWFNLTSTLFDVWVVHKDGWFGCLHVLQLQFKTYKNK